MVPQYKTAMSFLFCLALLVLSISGADGVLTARQRYRDDLIALYFRQGFQYKAILCYLHFVHGIRLSLRQLKRVLRKLGLQKRKGPDNRAMIQHLILGELNTGSGCLLGYRSMWKRLYHKHRTTCRRDTVMDMLRLLDPEGTSLRKQHRLQRRKYRNKGPNYVWHCDGFDKLKPYGFAIHGCIDGYSQKILWMEVETTNNNSAVIAHFYLKTVQRLGGAPHVLRVDRGTENSRLAYIQPFLRRHGEDCFADMDSVRFGKSVSNQRIEALWSQLKKSHMQWWMDLFKSMIHSGLLDETNVLQMDCLRFCFMHLLKEEISTFVDEWNCHRIRHSRQQNTIGGIPDELYFLPEIQGTRNYICDVYQQDIDVVEQHVVTPGPPATCSLEFLQLVRIIMSEHRMSFPTTIKDAVDLYAQLVVTLESEIVNFL